MGISFFSKSGSPISTLTAVTMPFSMVISASLMPAGVSILMGFDPASPRSYANFAKQRMPFPHISAVLPSLLRRRMRRSAF